MPIEDKTSKMAGPQFNNLTVLVPKIHTSNKRISDDEDKGPAKKKSKNNILTPNKPLLENSTTPNVGEYDTATTN